MSTNNSHHNTNSSSSPGNSKNNSNPIPSASLTLSYALVPPHSRGSQDTHILPITKILFPDYSSLNIDNTFYFLTCSRDGSIIKHNCNENGLPIDSKRMLAHSDWVNDIIWADKNDCFISVSNDFSIVLHTLDPKLDTWEIRIIGDHDDYIRSIVHISTCDDDTNFIFATAGLDKIIKIWSLDKFTREVTLLHTFDNSQDNDTGSIYSMVSPKEKLTNVPYDLIVGDNNGNIIFYSCTDLKEIYRLKNSHKKNVKCMQIVDNSTRLLTAGADNCIIIWNITNDFEKPKKIGHYRWKHLVWCIYGDSVNDLFVGDSSGALEKVSFKNLTKPEMLTIYNPNNHRNNTSKKPFGGILDICLLPSKSVLFSFSTDSNLNRLDLTTKNLTVKKGGFALVKSSLLTNRRHVITENTKSEIQRWDIISCELLDTFPPSEGNFDEVVMKYTSEEILNHWCTVSIKVGMLYIKLNTKLLDTEIYGSDLQRYTVINGIKLNNDERYNIGKVLINSLFNEFVGFETEKDKFFRRSLLAKRMKESLTLTNNDSNNNKIPSVADNKTNNLYINKSSLQDDTNTSDTDNKLNVALPSSPIIAHTHGPSSSINKKLSINTMKNSNELKTVGQQDLSSNELMESPLPTVASQNYSINATTTTPTMTQVQNTSMNEHTPQPSFLSAHEFPQHTPVVIDDTTKNINNETPKKIDEEENDTSSSKSSLGPLPSEASSMKKTGSGVSAANTSLLSLGDDKHDKKNNSEYMIGLIDKMHNDYEEYIHNPKSTKKIPDSKITRDVKSPIFEIKSGSVIIVQSWSSNCCGGRVVFNTYLPAPRNVEQDNSKDDNHSISEDDIINNLSLMNEQLNMYDFIDYENGTAVNRRLIFEQLEQNLPFWFSKILLNDTRVIKIQHKLSFQIMMWNPVAEYTEYSSGKKKQGDDRKNSSSLQGLMSFGKKSSKTNPAIDLPKLKEPNSKLIAPEMIKVKKIKTYIVERFDYRTTEMRNKVDPNDWIELLCRDKVLDSEMTLKSVKTLYWKSQNDIVIQFRRKL